MKILNRLLLIFSPLLPAVASAQTAQDSALVNQYITHMNDFGTNLSYDSQVEAIDLFDDPQSPVRLFDAEKTQIGSYIKTLREHGVHFSYDNEFKILNNYYVHFFKIY